jgi:hypothetical protein
MILALLETIVMSINYAIIVNIDSIFMMYRVIFELMYGERTIVLRQAAQKLVDHVEPVETWIDQFLSATLAQAIKVSG